MKIPLLNKPPKTSPCFFKWKLIWQVMLMMILGINAISVMAEGSKDFVNYPGYRMFLDTRDPQQLKVYANAGEFINVGSSHVGVQGGFIVVIDPFGDTIQIFDNTGNNTNKAIIHNNIQEMNGPIGTANSGYNPGVVPVPANKAGIWTIIFDYPSYENVSFLNILNNAPWTSANQPTSRRVVLAWDVTISSGAPGNMGGTLHEGRLYSNEHISLINGNGFNTSPVFYVLTPDGYLYQVNFMDADPFRFPISSNSRGLVNGNRQPVYKSKQENAFTRSNDPTSWDSNSLYLYEPQAEDYLGLINNKVFFNLPDTSMPESALVTDIFRQNTHETWLFNELKILFLLDFYFVGIDPNSVGCGPWVMQEGEGGWFVVNTTLPGEFTLELDLNNNGIFGEPIDVVLTGTIEPDTSAIIVDSIFWDGKNGIGQPLTLDPSFELQYKGNIRFGELHIAMTDVENNPGGVTFKWLNAPPTYADSLFYYDHSDIGGIVSGGGTPGNALPTSIPFDYSNNFGNDKYIDQWFFIEYLISPTIDTLMIVENCSCITGNPELSKVQDGGTYCSGEDSSLSAVNTLAGIGDLTYTWIRPNGSTLVETVAEGDTSVLSLNDLAVSDAGTYQVYAKTDLGCISDTLSFVVNVNPTPAISGITGGGSYCPGDDVLLSAVNTAAGISNLVYTWSGPGGLVESETVAGNATITLSLPGITEAQEGTYSLILTSDQGCVSPTYTANVVVNAVPVLGSLTGAGAYCQNDDITLTAVNSSPGITTMTCFWTGPNGFNTSQTVTGTDTVSLTLTNVNASFAGTYSLYCVSNTCTSGTVSFDVEITQTPEINAISPNGNFCIGASILLTAQNNQPSTGDITYTWTGPNPNNPLFPFTATLPADANGNAFGPFTATIPGFQPEDAGTYTLVLVAEGGCASVPQSVNIGVLPTPEICDVTGGGDACVGQDILLSASNCSPDALPLIFIWRRPDNTICSQGILGTSGPVECSIPNVQIDDAGTYTLTLTSDVSGCVSQPFSVELNVFPGLNIVDLAADSSYCEGADVVLTATNTVAAGDLTYTWTAPDGTVYGPFTVGSNDPLTYTVSNISSSQAGGYILNVTSEAGCTSEPDTVVVGVYDGVTIANVTGGGQYCSDVEVTLSATVVTNADSITWSWTGPGGVVLTGGTDVPPGPFIATLPSPVEGDYTFTVVTFDGCEDSETVSISIFAQPVAQIVNGDTTLCELDTLTICGQNLTPGIDIFDYTWVTPNGDLITGVGTGNDVFCDEISPLVTYGSGLYTLVISANGCTSEPDSVFIELNPNPVISTFTGGGTYCDGDTALVCFWNTNPAVDSFFYTCLLPGGIQTTGIGATGDTICVEMTASGFIFCSLESFEGCVSSLGGTEVIFLPSPDVEITSPDVVCANETLSLNAVNNAPGSGTVTYTWTGPGGFTFTGTAPWAGPFPAEDPAPESGEYCITVSSGDCVDNACIEVTVNPVPEVVGNVIGGGGEYCEGENVTLTATIQISDGSDIDYAWTFNGNVIETGTAPSGSVLTLDLGAVANNEEGEYCLELTSNQDCVADPVCTTITVNPTPTILTVTGGGTYCESLDVQLNGTGTPGLGTVNYVWLDQNGNEICSGTAPSAGPFPCTIEDVTVDQAGAYTLILSLGDCDSEPASVFVEVNPMPMITETGGGGEFCEGESTTVTFTIDPKGATSVNWVLSGPIDSSGTVTNVTTLSFDITVTNATAGSYTLTATSDQGCEAEPMVVTVSIKQVPTPELIAEPNPLCPGDELQLSTTAPPGTNISYEWFKDGVSLGTTTVPVFNVLNPTAGNYSVTVNVDGCTEASAEVAVTVLALPDAVNDAYEGNPGTSVTGNVLDNDQTGSGVTVTIVNQPANGSVTINPNGTFTYTPNSGAVAEDQFTYQICLTACGDVCDQAVVTITFPNIPCVVPNVLTPNGDGDNDVLIIDCIEQNPNNSLKVFNRWGDEIFSAEPYLNNWQGTYGNDGKELPAATYFYLFRKDKSSSEVTGGYIEVVR